MALLSVNHVSRLEKGVFVVKNVSFSQQHLQKIAIAGETGSGKTSLLKMIGGLLQPDEGEILWQGKRVPGPLEKLLPGHPSIKYLSQHFELRNNYRVEEELEARNRLDDAAAMRVYEICRITHLLKRRTDQLSGGERQRIVLAQLLITTPSVLLLDEPFSNLDAIHKSVIKSVIHDISNELNISCILVSHDAVDILSWADMILVLQNGSLIQQGTPEEIYRQPVNEYCAALFGEYNILTSDMFAILSGETISGEHIIIRPEDFCIGKETISSVSAIVKDIAFCGGYYLISLLAGNTLLKVKTIQHSYAKGEMVAVSLANNKV